MSVAEVSPGAQPGRLSVEFGLAVLAKSLEMQKQSVDVLDKILEGISSSDSGPARVSEGGNRIDLLA